MASMLAPDQLAASGLLDFARTQNAVRRLCDALLGQSIPVPLFWRHMPAAQEFADAVELEKVLIWRVMRSLDGG